MEDVLNKAKVTGIDGVYLPVADRKAAEAWYAAHYDPDGNKLKTWQPRKQA